MQNSNTILLSSQRANQMYIKCIYIYILFYSRGWECVHLRYVLGRIIWYLCSYVFIGRCCNYSVIMGRSVILYFSEGVSMWRQLSQCIQNCLQQFQGWRWDVRSRCYLFLVYSFCQKSASRKILLKKHKWASCIQYSGLLHSQSTPHVSI